MCVEMLKLTLENICIKDIGKLQSTTGSSIWIIFCKDLLQHGHIHFLDLFLYIFALPRVQELSCYDRDCWAHTVWNIYYLSLQKKIVSPVLYVSIWKYREKYKNQLKFGFL